jgi:hypothetical protein
MSVHKCITSQYRLVIKNLFIYPNYLISPRFTKNAFFGIQFAVLQRSTPINLLTNLQAAQPV